jgi:hypothetical protein
MSIHWGGRGAGHISRWSLGASGSPSLELNFLSGTLDPRITFTRGSNATLVDSTGSISYAPANLALHSADVTQSSWAKLVGGTAASATTFNFTSSFGSGFETQTALVLPAGTKVIASFFASGSGTIQIGILDASGAFGSTYTTVVLTGTLTRYSVTRTLTDANALLRIRNTSGSAVTGATCTQMQVEPVTYQTVASSYVATSTTAYYGPRFDYDPATLAAKGLLIEEQRRNLFLNSKTDGTSLSTQSVTVAAVPHTISFYGTGTITLTGASAATVTGTGVYPNRRTLTFTPIVGVLVCTVSGSVQYAQLEAGSFVTSFIPTGGTAVTRNADIARMTGTNFSSWYNDSEGTLIAKYETSPNLFATYVAASNGSVGQNSIHFDNDSGGTMRAVYYSGSVAQAILSLGAYGTAGALNTVASAYSVDNFAASRNGGAVVTDTLGAVPVSVTQLNIGADPSGVAANVTNTHIVSITYYKTRLLDSQLQALTQ